MFPVVINNHVYDFGLNLAVNYRAHTIRFSIILFIILICIVFSTFSSTLGKRFKNVMRPALCN